MQVARDPRGGEESPIYHLTTASENSPGGIAVVSICGQRFASPCVRDYSVADLPMRHLCLQCAHKAGLKVIPTIDVSQLEAKINGSAPAEDRRRGARCCVCGDRTTATCRHKRRDGSVCAQPICSACGDGSCPEHAEGQPNE